MTDPERPSTPAEVPAPAPMGAPAPAVEPAQAAAPAPVQVRQGDVLLVPVAELNLTTRTLPRVGGRVVLAEGEATGHAHAVRSSAATLVVADNERYLRVAAPVTLDHEEHAPLRVAPGIYRVVIQREYVPPEISPVAFRRVVD
jgi:hypothetical protein